MNWRSALVTNCAVLFLFAFGCSTVYARPSDACSLVTAEQVSSVLGIKVEAGQHRGTDLSCQWSVLPKIVAITIESSLIFEMEKNQSDPAVTKSDAKGIGDDAFYAIRHNPASRSTLDVKKGDTIFHIQVLGFPDDEIKAKEKTLALNILAKL